MRSKRRLPVREFIQNIEVLIPVPRYVAHPMRLDARPPLTTQNNQEARTAPHIALCALDHRHKIIHYTTYKVVNGTHQQEASSILYIIYINIQKLETIMSNSQKNQDQFNQLRHKANLKNEREKEPQYKQMFLDILQTHRGILNSPTQNTHDYKAEKEILNKIVAVERDAITGAIVVGVAAFLTVRYLPHLAVRWIGGEKKSRALREAERRSREGPNAMLKSVGGFLFEGTFGFWAAYRGYHLAVSMRSEDIYEDIVNIPLCEGRSIVSDSLCDEFADLIHYKIPPDFWKNLDRDRQDGGEAYQKLSNEEFFRGILQFEGSCNKRKAMEKAIRRRHGLSDSEPVSIPAPGVSKELSEDEIKAMLA